MIISCFLTTANGRRPLIHSPWKNVSLCNTAMYKRYGNGNENTNFILSSNSFTNLSHFRIKLGWGKNGKDNVFTTFILSMIKIIYLSHLRIELGWGEVVDFNLMLVKLPANCCNYWDGDFEMRKLPANCWDGDFEMRKLSGNCWDGDFDMRLLHHINALHKPLQNLGKEWDGN